MAKLVVPKPENYSCENPRLLDESGNEIWRFSTGEPVELWIGNRWLLFRWEINERGWYATNNQVSLIPIKVEARQAR